MMQDSLLIRVAILATLCAVLIVIVLLASYWYRHYSRHAKLLGKRLSEIVNVRNQSDDLFIKPESHALAVSKLNFRLFSGVLESIKLLLLRADLEIEIYEFLSACALAWLGAFIFFWISEFSFVASCFLGVIFACLPFVYVKVKEYKRRVLIEQQLPQALDFIGRSLRVGYAITISFGMVSEELPDPIGGEFRKLYEEVNFGLSLSDALSNFAKRMNSPDINFFVAGLLIQQEVGGNLIHLLETITKTIRDRAIFAGKVKILASESKYSAMLLVILPFALGTLMSWLNPEYMAPLWSTDLGQQLIIFGLLMVLIGGIWMSRIIRIKV